MQLLSGRQLPGKELFVVRFEGINDRTAAEGLVHQELLVASDDLPELEEGNSICWICRASTCVFKDEGGTHWRGGGSAPRRQ